MLSAGAVISVFSVTLVTIYGQTRILYAISRDGLIPKTFQKLSMRTAGTGQQHDHRLHRGGLVAGLVDSTFLWDMVSMGTLTAFIVVSIAVPVMRKRERRNDRQGLPRAVRPLPDSGPVDASPACTSSRTCRRPPSPPSRSGWRWRCVTYFAYGIRNSRLNDAK